LSITYKHKLITTEYNWRQAVDIKLSLSR